MTTKKTLKKSIKGKKDCQFVIRMNSEDRDQFVALCDALDTIASRELRRFIRQFLRDNKDVEAL
ncbi:MAG: hypothetical protein Q9N02_01215 [Ghiorsea sp.]|nr:hypothetical protein [Ghiorsea sp.]